MPFATNPTELFSTSAAYLSPADNCITKTFRHYFESDAIRSTVNDIRIAGIVYPLRKACEATFIPVSGEFVVEGFSPLLTGRGATPDEAQHDWFMRVHSAFQEIGKKRPFERSSAENQLWSLLSSRIDVTVHRNQTPIRFRQYGRVKHARPFPSRIEWENGKFEDVSIDQVNSPDFITYKPGQPFEAVVERDPISAKLLRIAHIERRPETARMARAEEAALLSEIGSRKTLPDVAL